MKVRNRVAFSAVLSTVLVSGAYQASAETDYELANKHFPWIGLASTVSPEQACDTFKNLRTEAKASPAFGRRLTALGAAFTTSGIGLGAWMTASKLERDLVSQELNSIAKAATSEIDTTAAKVAGFFLKSSEIDQSYKVIAEDVAKVIREKGLPNIQGLTSPEAVHKVIMKELKAAAELWGHSNAETRSILQLAGVKPQFVSESADLLATAIGENEDIFRRVSGEIYALIRDPKFKPSGANFSRELKVAIGDKLRGPLSKLIREKVPPYVIEDAVKEAFLRANAPLKATLRKISRGGKGVSIGAGLSAAVLILIDPSDAHAATSREAERNNPGLLMSGAFNQSDDEQAAVTCDKLMADDITRERFMIFAQTALSDGSHPMATLDPAMNGPQISAAYDFSEPGRRNAYTTEGQIQQAIHDQSLKAVVVAK